MLRTTIFTVLSALVLHNLFPYLNFASIRFIGLVFVSIALGNILSLVVESILIVTNKAKLDGRVALITGGTSGIGLELAKLFVRDECTVILVSNDPPQLVQSSIETLSKVNKKSKIIFEQLDLSGDDTSRIALFDKINNDHKLVINYMVNNAGFGMIGEFYELSWEKQKSMIMVNVLAVAHMTHLFLNSIKHQTNKKDRFRILNTSSMVSVQPVPLFAAYSATKAFVKFLTFAISTELEKHDITATALMPGPTTTPFLQKSSYDRVAWFSGLEKSSPKYVAQCGYYHMLMGNVMAIPGFSTMIVRFFMYVMPLQATLKILYTSNIIKK
jgi:short-subunit dehydrogenase